MQSITQTLADAVRGNAQDLLSKVEVLAADRTTVLATITDHLRLEVQGARTKPDGRAVRRSCILEVDNTSGQYTPDPSNLLSSLFWWDKWLRPYLGYQTAAGAEWLQLGELSIDKPLPGRSPDRTTLRVTARDGAKKLMTRFGKVLTFAQSGTESADYAKEAGASASASSALAAGDQIESQGSVAVQAYGTILGVRQRVEASLTGDVRSLVDRSTATGLTVSFGDPGLSKLEAVVRLDLLKAEDLQSITPQVTAGTVTSLRTSSDAQAWTAQPTAGAGAVSGVRYIELTVEAAAVAGSASVTITELEVKTAAACPAGQAVDGDANTSWRPSLTDLDRTLTITFASSRTFNQVMVRLGTADTDVWNRAKVKVEALEAGFWVTRHTTARRVAGRWEIPFEADIAATAIRLTLIEVAGVALVRDVAVKQITQQNTISYLIGQIATDGGETKTRIAFTRQFYPYTIGWGEKDERWAAIAKLAASIGWEVGYSWDGYLEAGPPDYDPTVPDWEILEGGANLLSITAEPDDQVINHWKVVGASVNFRPVSAEAKDDRINSPTGIPNIGQRYDQVFDPLANTTEKCQARAAQLLAESTRIAIPVKLQHLALPHIEEGDVITVQESHTHVDGVYQVESWRLTIDPGRATQELQLQQIVR